MKEVPVAAASGTSSTNGERSAAYRASAANEDAGADEPGHEVTDPTAERNSQQSKKEAGNRRTNDAENNVHEDAGVALHEVGCNPTRKTTDDDSCNPAYAVVHICYSLRLKHPHSGT